MKYAKLGHTDLKVSRICLGTMTWGKQNNQEEAFAQMDYALGEGVNFWDTAEMYAIPPTPDTYGTTETMIGNWFAETGKRDEVILATKFSPMTSQKLAAKKAKLAGAQVMGLRNRRDTRSPNPVKCTTPDASNPL